MGQTHAGNKAFDGPLTVGIDQFGDTFKANIRIVVVEHQARQCEPAIQTRHRLLCEQIKSQKLEGDAMRAGLPSRLPRILH